MEFFSDRQRRIHAAVLTEGARAAVEYADDLLREAADLDGSARVDLVKEARQWNTQAFAIDKHAADAEIARLAKLIDDKLGRRRAGDDLDEMVAQRNVIPIASRGGG